MSLLCLFSFPLTAHSQPLSVSRNLLSQCCLSYHLIHISSGSCLMSLALLYSSWMLDSSLQTDTHTHRQTEYFSEPSCNCIAVWLGGACQCMPRHKAMQLEVLVRNLTSYLDHREALERHIIPPLHLSRVISAPLSDSRFVALMTCHRFEPFAASFAHLYILSLLRM